MEAIPRVPARPAPSRRRSRLSLLTAHDWRSGRVRTVTFEGRWLHRPSAGNSPSAAGVRYAVAVDTDGWLVVCRSGSEGGVLPSVRYYVDAAQAAADGVPPDVLDGARG